MSLQRRLLLYLLLSAPLVWAAALLISANRAQDEVNEIYDAEIIHLARQMQATLLSAGRLSAQTPAGRPPGEADLRDLAIAVWDAKGQLLLGDREGVLLPHRPDASGFVELALDGSAWRVYYLQAPDADWLVATGQRLREREELVWELVLSQMVPWLLVLPVLLLAIAWAVRRALAPLRTLAADLKERAADDLQPVPAERAPQELQPLLAAMNGLFGRIETALTHERRFTADAAHELRTPLAVVRAQWDVLRAAADGAERREAEARLGAGLDRMDRLVTQMLALSRLEATEHLPKSTPIAWPRVVEQAMSDVLATAERRHVELACDWPERGRPPFPLQGDPDLIAVLMRNLLDNAVRYSPEHGTVTLSFSPTGLSVENAGAPLSQELVARLGERFRRTDGQRESGSGLGVSIAQRVAALHGLVLRYGTRADGSGVRVDLTAP